MDFAKRIFFLFSAAVFAACAAAADVSQAAQAQGVGALSESASPAEEKIDYEKLAPQEIAKIIKTLPQTETDPEVLAYEQKVLNSDFKDWRLKDKEHQICLALSLYYLGWGKDVFERLGHGVSFYVPTNRQMREGRGAIRDAKKAYLYTLLSYNFEFKANALAYFYYEGIFVKKDLKKVEKLFFDHMEPFAPYDPVFNSFEEMCAATFIYWLVKDSGYKPGDQIKGKFDFKFEKYYHDGLKNSARNIYAGFFAPQDKEFAISYLKDFENADDMSIKYIYDLKYLFDSLIFYMAKREFVYDNLILYYGGELDASKKDEAMVKKYIEKYRAEHLDRLSKIKNKRLLKNIKVSRHFFYGIKNPIFDETLIEEYAANVIRGRKDFKKMAPGLFVFLCADDAMAVLPKLKERAILPEDDFKKFEEEFERAYKARKFIDENFFPAAGNFESK